MTRNPGELAALVAEFRALPADDDRRRAIIAELDGDPGAEPFLIGVVADPEEYDLARTEAATLLRLWPPADPDRRREAGRALLAALDDPEEDLVRQYAAMALGPYADAPAVRRALTAAAEAGDDPLVRAAARSALAEAGPDGAA
ncbi:HEAT repeat domain-containing protein [Streptomyces sp. NPDC002225]|uniref:HEAT repeat domain-containing protein n=1 Tax=Streptomyces sp. NPDC002225 TaxID=3154413 RepID=UPI00332FB940